jgi:hypothetical protein
MTWEALKDGLDAHLNTSMSYLPRTIVVVRRFLLRDISVFKLSKSEASTTRGPTARVSVLPFLPEYGRRSSFRNVVI